MSWLGRLFGKRLERRNVGRSHAVSNGRSGLSETRSDDASFWQMLWFTNFFSGGQSHEHQVEHARNPSDDAVTTHDHSPTIDHGSDFGSGSNDLGGSDFCGGDFGSNSGGDF